MKKLRKVIPFAAVGVWLLLLLPFFLGSVAAHPATDDFTFAVYTHKTWLATHSLPHVVKDALSYALRTWRDWQGTVTGVIVMALNPAVFSISGYGSHAVLLLALDLLAWYVFTRHMFSGRLGLPRRISAGAFLCLSACQLMFMPDIVEGIYWFNGAWFYTGAQAAALLVLVLCDHLAGNRMRGGKRIAAAVLCCAALFALGMDNYITAMMALACLFMMAMQRLWAKEKREALVTALLLLPLAAGLLLSVIAPGNNVRMETDGAHQSGMGWLIASIGWTMRDAAKYFVRFGFKTPVLALCVLSIPLQAKYMPQKREKLPPVVLTILGGYAILCAMIIPHMYSSGYAGSGRVVNMYHGYVMLALPLMTAMCIGRMTPAQRSFLSGKSMHCGAVFGVLLCVCLASGQLANYGKLISDQMDGTQVAYIEQFKNEYALCEAGGENDDVLLPPWTVQTVTGKPTAYEDASMWTNEAMAQYFGVKSVRVGR